MNTRTTAWKAPDIDCDGCAAAIKRALGKMPGVAGVDVDVPTRIVTVRHDPEQASAEAVAATLDKVGFPAAPA